MIYTWFLTNGLKLGGIVALFGLIWLHGCHYGSEGEKENTHKVQTAFNKFVSKTEELGKAAEVKAKQIEAADKLRKEKADAENFRTITELRDSVARLRRARSSGGYLAPASATAKSPDTITFDRAELERAIRQTDERIQELISEGDEARINLDTAIRWAAENFQAK